MFKSLSRWLGAAPHKRSVPKPFRYAVLEHRSGERVFVKTYPEYVREEFARGQKLGELAQRTGLFGAPTPLALLAEHRLILWSYIEGLVEMREYLTQDIAVNRNGCARRNQLFCEAGEVLAVIHAGFSQMETSGDDQPAPLQPTGHADLDRHVASAIAQSPRHPLHWDYACGNLFVTLNKNSREARLVVIDAMPNHYVLQKRGPSAVCPVYVDVGQFIYSLYCHPVFSPAIAAEVEEYKTNFLAGYEKRSGTRLDEPTAFVVAENIGRLYQDLRRPKDRALNSTERREWRFREDAGRRLIQMALQKLSSASTSARGTVCAERPVTV